MKGLALAIALAIAAPVTPAIAEPLPGVLDVAELRAGDVLVRLEDERWRVVKILAVEVAPDGSRIAHVMLYQPQAAKPTLIGTRNLDRFLRHAPLDAVSLTQGYEKLGNLPPSEEELEGYRFYLQGFE